MLSEAVGDNASASRIVTVVFCFNLYRRLRRHFPHRGKRDRPFYKFATAEIIEQIRRSKRIKNLITLAFPFGESGGKAAERGLKRKDDVFTKSLKT